MMDSVQHVQLKIKKLRDDAHIPAYGGPSDAGLDLCSLEDWTLKPGEQHTFKIGIAIAVPDGFVGLVWDRSGMAARNGVKTMAGVIDCTYRGEVGIVLVNVTNKPYDVKQGDRIAQLLIQPIATAEVQVVEELDDTQRGNGGFGSSGR
jgi:dUTP pyrophosphatase